jgi:TPR repeat protein
MKKWLAWWSWSLVALTGSFAGAADLYKATAAVDKQDYARAFEIFRELAEMGHPGAQENLAVMYVNGEGVKRDNVLGYAWATLALENGGGEAAKGIVDQLAPHLTSAASARVAEVQDRFGREALKKSLFPVQLKPPPAPQPPCSPTTVANPDDFYPEAMRARAISGNAVVELTIFGDGRAHDPRVVSSYPPEEFDEAGRNVSLHNRHKSQYVNHIAVPCVVKIKIVFTAGAGGRNGPAKQDVDAAYEKARRGDPVAQLTYAYLLENQGGSAKRDEWPMQWFLKAAQAGVPAAQFLVGSRLLSGTPVVEKDETKGLAWLNMAASAGSPEAHLALANYHLRKSPDPVALAAAIDHFGKADLGGSPDAAYYLAALLATGPDATLRDPARALELIEKAKAGYEMNPTWSEIRAAAYAAAGNFDRAQVEQTAAVHAAGKLGWSTAPQKARLAEYKAGKAWSGDLFAFY